MAEAQPSFCSMKHLHVEVLLLPSPPSPTPNGTPNTVSPVPINIPGLNNVLWGGDMILQHSYIQ